MSIKNKTQQENIKKQRKTSSHYGSHAYTTSKNENTQNFKTTEGTSSFLVMKYNTFESQEI
jgi:hypothetical protein